MQANRRTFLASLSALAVQTTKAVAAIESLAAPQGKTAPPDYSLRIEPCTLDIGKGIQIRTLAYNGQVPGPTVRMKKGVPVHIDVTNASLKPDIVHWHGLKIRPREDGAMEEGSPMIAPGETLRYAFTPAPSGTRWYHTHASAYDDLSAGTYSGQFGFLLVDGEEHSPAYDQEINLAIHHWEPSFVPMVSMLRSESENAPQTSGSDVGCRYATMNGHMLGSGEPIRVKQGQRVLFRLLNASATENTVLSFPGHTFQVIAMDGNAVPNPKPVEILSLAVAERIDAIVEMNSPGVWVLGSTSEASRTMGLGVVVEYAGSTGTPVWNDPPSLDWDYAQFANSAPADDPHETFTLTFRDAGQLNGSKFDTWTINGDAWPKIKPLKVKRGRRYRLRFRNASGDQHPMHLHRHTFEISAIGGRKMSGLMKDVVNVMPLDTVAVDFVADNPGDTLMHCHQQLHMDYGFMQLIQYVD